MTLNAGTSTCPVCAKTWTVTPAEDCMLPACGCFGHDASPQNPARPCEQCGVGHAWTCEKMPPSLSGPHPVRHPSTLCDSLAGTYRCQLPANHVGDHRRRFYTRSYSNKITGWREARWRDPYGKMTFFVKRYRDEPT